MLQRRLAFLSPRERSIADRARGVEILRHPAESGGEVSAQIFVLALHCEGERLEIHNLLAPHKVRICGEHDRSLDVAAMDAVGVLPLSEQPIRIAETAPRGVHG